MSESDVPEASEMSKTPWFPTSTPPTRDGWYETMWDRRYPGADGPGVVEKQLWIGGAFCSIVHQGDSAPRLHKTGLGDFPGDCWRGVIAETAERMRK